MQKTINTQAGVPKEAIKDDYLEKQAATTSGIQPLLGSLRLNLTQPKCSDGGLHG